MSCNINQKSEKKKSVPKLLEQPQHDGIAEDSMEEMVSEFSDSIIEDQIPRTNMRIHSTAMSFDTDPNYAANLHTLHTSMTSDEDYSDLKGGKNQNEAEEPLRKMLTEI